MMKKLLIGSVALLLVCGMVGCGKQNEAVSPLDNVIFEDIEITVNDDSDDTYGTHDHTYPMEIKIQVKSNNSDIPDDYFSVEKTSANLKTIEYTISVDEDALQKYLEENHYVLKSVTKSYVTEVTELSSYLLSTEYLTEENIQILHDDMKNEVLKTIEWANCSMVYMIFADADKKHYYAWRTVNLRFTFNQTWKIDEATYFYVDNPVSYDNFEDAYAAIEKEYKDFTDIRGFEKIDLIELNS